MTMPIEAKIANVKSDLIKYVEISAREYGLPPFIMVGIIADILSDWKSKELVQMNDGFNEIIKTFNEQISKGEKEDVQN
jgi:hypothetical protein